MFAIPTRRSFRFATVACDEQPPQQNCIQDTVYRRQSNHLNGNSKVVCGRLHGFDLDIDVVSRSLLSRICHSGLLKDNANAKISSEAALLRSGWKYTHGFPMTAEHTPNDASSVHAQRVRYMHV